MKDTESAFLWIVAILQKHNIPFQITGGFPARLYGVDRELADIDFDIPEGSFSEIISDVKNYIVFGPARYVDKNWDLYLITLSYQGQEIDIGGLNAKIFDSQRNQWISLEADITTAKQMQVYGVTVPVVNKEKLIWYKKILLRDVDIIDIEQLQGSAL